MDRIGIAYDVTVADSAGHPWFDEAALKVADTMKFEPGTRHGEPTEYTVEVPVRFDVPLPSYLTDVGGASHCRTGPWPTNVEEVQKQLRKVGEDNALYQDVEAKVAVTVDAGGRVREVELVSSSDSKFFDQVALALASYLEFEPCMVDGTSQPARTVVPLRIRVK